MSDEARVAELLEELLESGATPESVCRACPELLPEVRRGWQRLRALEAEVGALFPASDSNFTKLAGETGSPQRAGQLPKIAGYEVEAVLGKGGMGVVFKAKHLKLNRTVALKMLLSGGFAGREERLRFQREAEAVAGLRHPNIVQVFDVGDFDGRPYFTMEFVEGGTLAELLAGTPQPARQAAARVETLARAIQAAHDGGIVHRDLKPANVLLTADGTAKITDFGLARRLQSDELLTFTGARVGTPSYMAPEQAAGKPSAVGPATDVYALGVILYEMLTGRPPFRAESPLETERQVIAVEPAAPSRLNARVPRDLETICLKCLQKDPRRRYGTAADLADDLGRFQRTEPILARRAGPFERTFKWANRHRSLAAALVSGALLLAVLIAVVGWVLVKRAVLAGAVEEDLGQVVQADQRQSWGEARTALDRAKTRLGDGGPQELRRRAEQFERELALVATLEEIREGRMTLDSAAMYHSQSSADFGTAFRSAGLIDAREDATVVASRIRSTGIAPALLMALDEWAWIEGDNRRAWLREVARQVDPDPVTRRIRDPKVWNDKQALEEFTRSAPIANTSIHFLMEVARQLEVLQGDPLPFLKRVQLADPSDYWVNSYLAWVLHGKNNPAEAVRYYQAAIAIRPNVAREHHNLWSALEDVGRHEEALQEIQIALQLAPGDAFIHNSAGLGLLHLGRFDEALREFRRATEIEPRSADYLSHVGECLAAQNQRSAAMELFRRAIALDPKCWGAHTAPSQPDATSEMGTGARPMAAASGARAAGS